MSATSPERIGLPVTGMTRGSCPNRIESTLNRLDGVSASVNYATGTASIEHEGTVAVEQLIAALDAAGYQTAIPAAEAEPTQDDPATGLRHQLIIGALLSVPVLLIAMIPALQFDDWQWLPLQMTTPVVLLRGLKQTVESPALTGAQRASGQGWARSLARLWLGDFKGAAEVAEQAWSTATAGGDHLATSIALGSFAQIAARCGCLPDAAKIIDDAVRLADQSPARQGHCYPVHFDRGLILSALDRLEEARSALDTGRRISEELGIGWHLPSYQMLSAFERFTAGEWDDALAEVEASLRLADATGGNYGLVLGHSVLSLISLQRNDLGHAEDTAAAALHHLAGFGPFSRAQWAEWAIWAHALTLEAKGKPTQAFVALADCWDRCAQSGLGLAFRVFGPDLIRLAIAAGAPALARDVAAVAASIARQNDVPSLTGAALRCRGLAESDAEILAEAAKAYGRSPRRLEHAQTCEDAGTLFAGQGALARARPLLEQAVNIYERLGATRALARAEAVLREAGVRRGRRGPRRRPQFGWPSLTPTEQTIATLVADGLSNPQIGARLYISRRTVQTHLGHVFAKLDITSRAQLATQTTRRRDNEFYVSTAPGRR